MARTNNLVLLVLTLLVGWVVAREIIVPVVQPAVAQTSGSTRNVTAVTGIMSSNEGALWVISEVQGMISGEKETHLSVYRIKNRKEVELIAARQINYDFQIMKYNDITEREFQVQRLKANIERAAKSKKAADERRDKRRNKNKKPEDEPSEANSN